MKVSDSVLWSKLFDEGQEPIGAQVKDFVDTPLWDDLAHHLQQTYNVQPKLFYSGCSMQEGYFKGWNVKYKKSGKALCTRYPKHGYFVALIAVGENEREEAERLLPLLNAYTQEVYRETAAGRYGKSLAIDVTSEAILEDVKKLIGLRAAKRESTRKDRR